ncbi:hypothetical protein [Diaminobutyricimonas sp. TR449]|uniref:hypothetical protein n=1 Tax=Diaminobutyricimonas sp. TR449 TaxID=2708076 RepID=UPI0014248B43|nr:hypothetical protein [Diaminobutyricimonas sp. TR449]
MSETGPNGESPEWLAYERREATTNDAAAGETVEGQTPEREAQPVTSQNDLADEDIDLDDDEEE